MKGDRNNGLYLEIIKVVIIAVIATKQKLLK